MKSFGSTIGVVAVCSLLFFGCANQQLGETEQGALAGTALGAGLGAIIGHETGHTGAGIAIGAATGLLGGGLLGKRAEDTNRAIADKDRRLDEQDKLLQENRRLIDELRRKGADVRDTKRGVVVNLPDVLFEFDRARLTSDARRTVADIAEVISGTEGRSIAVEGHTDSVGTIDYNQRLSEARARSTADELVHSGVAPRRIHTRGYGETDPIASNKTEEGRSRNRRVEVIIEN